MKNKADLKDISIIVQGGVDRIETPKCLASIRRHLPNAEIILSTWNNEPIDGLDYDILVLNETPQALLLDNYSSKKIYNNLNRQLLSTQEGLKKATKKYTLKLRSDLILENTNFLENFNKFPKRIEEYKLFEHKIIVPMLLTRYYYNNGKTRIKMPFHISDWCFFGLTSDIKKYFENTPLVEEPEFTKYFQLEENKNKKNPYGKLKHKFAPEQYFAISAFSRAFNDINMEDAADFNDELMLKYQKSLVNNFIVLDFKHSGIYLNKYPFSRNEKYIGDQFIDLYNFYRFEKDYQKFIDNNYEITSKCKVDETKEYYAQMRIYKHFYKIICTQTHFWKRIEAILVNLPIAIVKYIIQKIKGEKC